MLFQNSVDLQKNFQFCQSIAIVEVEICYFLSAAEVGNLALWLLMTSRTKLVFL